MRNAERPTVDIIGLVAPAKAGPRTPSVKRADEDDDDEMTATDPMPRSLRRRMLDHDVIAVPASAMTSAA